MTRKLRRCFIAALGLLVLSLAASHSRAADRVLLNAAQIVVDSRQPSFVQYGVEDLAGYLKESTGNEIPVIAAPDGVKAVQILVGTEAVGQVFPRLMPEAHLGEEAYLLKVAVQGNATYVIAAGATSQGTKAALAALMKTIQVEEKSAFVPTSLDVLGKPAFAKRGMHVNGWPLNYPYSFRSWREEDWHRYLDILSYQGVNLFYLWPFIEIMPVPLSPEDQAYLEECRRVVDYAQKKHGMEVWIMQCTNRVAKDRCGVADPRVRPYWRPTQEDLNPGKPENFQAILASREAMYRIIDNADGVCNIDSDPGFCADSSLDDYTRVLQACRALLDRYNIHGKETKLINWMLWGWGRKEKMQIEGLVDHQRLALHALKQGLPEPLWLISGQFPEYLPMCREEGLIARTVYLPYGVIEREPAYPQTNVQIDAIREMFDGPDAQFPNAAGVMGNVQTPLLQFPNLFFFTSVLCDFDYRKRSEKEVLLDLCSHLYPDHKQLLADCYLAMKEPDPAKVETLADRLDSVIREGKLGRWGVFGRKLFPDHRIAAQSLRLQLRLRAAQESLVLGVAPTTGKAECAKLVCNYFDAYLAWDTAHGWHELWGWQQWQPSDPRFPAVADRLRTGLGGDAEVVAFFDQIAQTLSTKYDARIVQEGCIAPVKQAVLASGGAPAGAIAADDMPAFRINDRILFQGDSITHGGRGGDPNHFLGHGYQFIIAAKYGSQFPERNLTFFNRGNSGDTVARLQARWKVDALDLKPNVLSILVGVNDLGAGVPAEKYEESYDRLLKDTVAALPNVRLILCEPFGLPVGAFAKVKGDWEKTRAELKKRQAIVAKLGAKYKATVVHFQKVFDDACRRAPAEYWIWDGVHPTYSGHQLMADEWIRTVACVLALSTAPALAADSPAVFSLDLDGAAVARTADGTEVKPLQADRLAFAPGITGQALRAEGASLVYPASVVPKDAGTIEIWTSPMPSGVGKGWYFFSGDASEWGQDGVPRLWMYEGTPRFDVDGGGRCIMGPLPSGALWAVGSWHQFVGTWDRSGKVELYVDGRLLAHKSVAPWAAPSRQGFTIGHGRSLDSKSSLPANALVDRVRIYDRVLSSDDIRAQFIKMGIPQIAVRLERSLFVKVPAKLPVTIENISGGSWSGSLQWSASQCSGKIPVADLQPGQTSQVTMDNPLPTGASGAVTVDVSWNEGIKSRVAHTQSLSAYIPPPLPAPAMKAPDFRLVRVVNCAEEAPVTEIGKSVVVEGSAGRCREAGSAGYDRFAYTFKLSGSGHLLRLTVEHPDDKKRCTMISYSIPKFLATGIAGSEQQVLGHGILSGGIVPITNGLVTRQFVFPCPANQVGIIVETGTRGQPAAACTLRLDEASATRYGPAAAAPALGARDHRYAGLYWEDPVIGQNFGWTGTDYAQWDQTFARAMDYLAWTGQDILVYPTVWYNGPIYKSRVEPGTWPSGGRYHPAEYPRLIAARCAERGIKFVPTYTIWRLPSLATLICTPEEVVAGKPSVNTVTREGNILTTANWGSPPLLNAQHQSVQKAILDLIDEHVAMCGDLPSFAGVGFALWPSSPMQVGAVLATSYDDWSLTEFAKHTGAKLPGDTKSPERFKQRADWVLGDPARKAAWIRWRCECMTRFYAEAARHLAAAGPNAKLRLMIQQPYPARDGDVAQELLEQGLDLEALAQNPQIILDRWLNQTAHRSLEKDGQDSANIYYDQAELTPHFQKPFAGLPRTSATVHQQYFESHQVLGNRSAPKLKFPPPWEIEAYGRACQPVPWGRHFLRHWARSVFLFDAQWLSIGGFSVGTFGAETEVREFVRAFKALPQVPFSDVGCTGAVVVRTGLVEDFMWVYAVNITNHDAPLTLKTKGGVLQDAVTSQTTDSTDGVSTILRPYDLRVWRTVPTAAVTMAQPAAQPEQENWATE